MILCNSKIVQSPSVIGEFTSVVRSNAHCDGEVSHCCASVESIDVSSTFFHGERVSSGSSRAECLPPHMTHGRHKWSYNENIELMHCFYLAKRGGVGYCDHLKNLWDSRNPSKCSISVNTLCCHA